LITIVAEPPKIRHDGFYGGRYEVHIVNPLKLI